MKSLKSKLILPLIALGISAMPILGQNNSNENKEWETTIGTCGIYPNDEVLKELIGSYFGIQAEAQKQVKDNLYVGVNGTYGFGRYKDEEYNLRAGLKEISALGIYKIDRLELSLGPKIALLNVSEEQLKTGKFSNKFWDETYDKDFSGIGWEGRIKYKLYDGEKIDVSAMGAYSRVEQDDPTAWPNLGSTKLSFILEF